MNKWTEEEINLLHDNWDLRMENLLKLLPDRTRASINHKIKRLGYTRTKQILREQDYEYIIKNIEKPNKVLARELDVSPPVITRAFKELNVYKSQHWTQTEINTSVEESPFTIHIKYKKVIEVDKNEG